MTSKTKGSGASGSKSSPARSRAKPHPATSEVSVEGSDQKTVQPRKRAAPPGKKSQKWPIVRKEYIEGIPVEGTKDEVRLPTMKELSERHGIAHTTIRERAAKERWTTAQQEYQVQLAKERQAKRAKGLAKNAIEFDERAYNAANLGLSIVQVRLAEIMQEIHIRKPIREAALELIKEGQPVDKTDLYSGAYHKELEGLASALDRFQTIGMRALGTDAKKIELTGEGGGPIQSQINIHAELVRDDAERTAAILGALVDSGQLPQELLEALAVAEGDEDIVDAEVVEDDDSGPRQIEGGS